jgi:DNA-binding GntR family transcriptional regulator
VNEIYRLRYLIEKTAVEKMAKRWDREHAKALYAITDNMKRSVENNMLSDLIESDVSFHRYICQHASVYSNLINIWETLVGKTYLAIGKYNKLLSEQGNISVTLNHHIDMIEAFESTDEQKLMKAFERHWSLIFKMNAND